MKRKNNGGVLGKQNLATKTRATGVWGLDDVQQNRTADTWPTMEYAVDIFLAGGGGGGTNNGGAGGKTSTYTNVLVTKGTGYNIQVGAGGAADTNGGYSRFNNNDSYRADGGYSSSQSPDGRPSGGSGGGSYGGGYSGGGGGSNGGNGGLDGGGRDQTRGYGQGTTTRQFGDSARKLYGAGGGGGSAAGGGGGGATGGGNGGYGSAGSATATYGAGGGGVYSYNTSYLPGQGSGGEVVIRYLGAQRGSGGTVTSEGGYTYHTFSNGGTYTA